MKANSRKHHADTAAVERWRMGPGRALKALALVALAACVLPLVGLANPPAADTRLAFPSGRWSVTPVGFPSFGSGSAGVLEGSTVVALELFEAAAGGDTAGTVKVLGFGSDGAVFTDCDVTADPLLAGGLTFSPDCSVSGRLILRPIGDTCQVVFRYLPEDQPDDFDPVTIGLGLERNPDCPRPMQGSPPGFARVAIHGSIVVNGVLLDYWRGHGEDGEVRARLDLKAKDGSSVTINADAIWQEGAAGQTMSFLSPEDLGDATGTGEPTITLGSAHGDNCCRSLYLIQLSEDPQLLAISSAAVDSLGWEPVDLDGDGSSELIAGGGDLLELGCTLGITSPLAIAAYKPQLGTYVLETGNWLHHYDDVATDTAAMSAVLSASMPLGDVAAHGNNEFRCELASVVLPALAAGLINEQQLREVVSGLFPIGTAIDDLVDPLLGFVRDYPAGFDVRTAPWERLINTDQLFIMTCPAIQHALDLIGMGSPHADATGESVVLAETNRAILEAYSKIIECTGPALTSLDLRLGSEPPLCLELTQWPSLCGEVLITANWTLLEAIYNASTRLAEQADILPFDRQRLEETVRTSLDGCSGFFDSCFASATAVATDEVARFALDAAQLWTAKPGYQ